MDAHLLVVRAENSASMVTFSVLQEIVLFISAGVMVMTVNEQVKHDFESSRRPGRIGVSTIREAFINFINP
jgi:hypothetical protein